MFFSTKSLFVLATVACSVISNVILESNYERGLDTFTSQSGVHLHAREFKVFGRGETCEVARDNCMNKAGSKFRLSSIKKAQEKCESTYRKCVKKRDKSAIGPSQPPTGSSSSQAQGTSEPSTCLVCIEDIMLGEPTSTLRCGHSFHEECIEGWFKKQDEKSRIHIENTCPTCKRVHWSETNYDSD